MEFKGTKGNWKVVQKGEPSPYNNNCGYHTVNASDDKNDTIADIWFSDNHVTKTKEEALYNAKLIACAPELLEALNWALNELSELNGNYKQLSSISEQVELARELIRQATE